MEYLYRVSMNMWGCAHDKNKRMNEYKRIHKKSKMLIETAFCLTSTRWRPFTVQRLLIPAPVPHQSQQFLKQTDVDGNSDSDICFWVVGRQRLSRGTAGEVWIMWSSTVSLQEGDRCLSIQLPVFFVVFLSIWISGMMSCLFSFIH